MHCLSDLRKRIELKTILREFYHIDGRSEAQKDIKAKEEQKEEKKEEEKDESKAETKASNKDKPSYNDGVRLILGSASSRIESKVSSKDDKAYGGAVPSLFKSPSMRSLGFPTPMSFLQNFQVSLE